MDASIRGGKFRAGTTQRRPRRLSAVPHHRERRVLQATPADHSEFFMETRSPSTWFRDCSGHLGGSQPRLDAFSTFEPRQIEVS